MPRKRCSPEQIISKLREAEVLLAQGRTRLEVYRALNVSEQTNDRASQPSHRACSLKRATAPLPCG